MSLLLFLNKANILIFLISHVMNANKEYMEETVFGFSSF